jgi:heme o synthase
MQTVQTEAALGSSTQVWRQTLTAYFWLTKPRIIYLLLITTVPAMVLAQQGMPSLWLIVATLIGGSLSAAGANVINCYLDRDIDEIMDRTRRRPLPAGRIEPRHALAFGVILGILGFVWLTFVVNPLSAVLATSGLLFYVFVYTLWLKRTSPQNIVIGGAAGAVPPLVGWAAVTNSVTLGALALFVIIFVWTPPHFWALALRYQTDYARAGVPMLPVVAGGESTRRQIMLYSVALVVVSVAPVILGTVGIFYLVVALVLGVLFIRSAIQVYRDRSMQSVMGLFHFSIAYLGLLFAAMVVDQLLFP